LKKFWLIGEIRGGPNGVYSRNAHDAEVLG